jgi:hypothetical protein
VDPENAGPELTGMGGHHPAEYFAESLLTPNAVIVKGPGYAGPDGRSIMRLTPIPCRSPSWSISSLTSRVSPPADRMAAPRLATMPPPERDGDGRRFLDRPCGGR